MPGQTQHQEASSKRHGHRQEDQRSQRKPPKVEEEKEAVHGQDKGDDEGEPLLCGQVALVGARPLELCPRWKLQSALAHRLLQRL